MSNAHLFIVVVFGGLLALNCINYRRTMRRYDREDAMNQNRRAGKRAIYLGKDSRTPMNACLDCGEVLDAASGIGHRNKPKAGSISICIRCGHIMAFDWQLRFRPLTDEEVVMIAGDPVVIAAQNAAAAYRAHKKAKADGESKSKEEADDQATL